MATGNLTPLQARILEVLARVEPRWTLTGGGATVGFHAKHRVTKDLDLFWRDCSQLGDLPRECTGLLEPSGLETEVLQTSPTFVRWRIKRGSESCILGLVADPVSPVHAPQSRTIGTASFLVDAPEEILINKLVALFSRSELRDLADVKQLLESSLDLKAGVDAALKRDSGFSPLKLAWLLHSFPIEKLAEKEDYGPEMVRDLDEFRRQLAERMIGFTKPGDRVFERP
ncbi:MAG: nucleotidyl transferase AbiEii/AbiGii toxin family protein [Planctomycetes bacterium]|nr:nucleotidyl transferase AbiEii/AbiGii toxin family protein [Planctomycetota bacterium]